MSEATRQAIRYWILINGQTSTVKIPIVTMGGTVLLVTLLLLEVLRTHTKEVPALENLKRQGEVQAVALSYWH